VSSDKGNNPKERLNEIAERFRLLHAFLAGVGKEDFLKDTMRKYAVVRALEEVCEAALWFEKNKNGEELKNAYPDVNFRRFGNAGNVFRHQYETIDYEAVWNNIIFGSDIEAMERLLEKEVPFYQRQLSRQAELVDKSKVIGTEEVSEIARRLGFSYYSDNEVTINVTESGGHHKVKIPGEEPFYFIDRSALAGNNRAEKGVEALLILATELDCKEAGLTLIETPYIKRDKNGEYVRNQPFVKQKIKER